jgi:hypothetical protein
MGPLSPRHADGCGRKRRPPDTEGSGEYIEYAVAGCWKVIILQLWVGLTAPLHKKYYTGPRTWTDSSDN